MPMSVFKNAFYNLIDRSLWHCFLKRRVIDYERVAYWCAARESADFMVSHMSRAAHFRKKRDLLLYALKAVEAEGLWLEFGVYEGRDIRVIAGKAPGPVHGFDSFEGLPEDWTHFQKKGRFDRGGRLPEDVPGNVHFVKGWFEETIPEFMKRHDGRIAFMHVDSDLYSSANTIFNEVSDRILDGTVILFDDFLNYPGWKEGESKAFFEFLDRTGKTCDYLGFASSHHSVAVRIKNPE